MPEERRNESQVRQDIGRLEGKLEILITLTQANLLEQKDQNRSMATMSSDIKALQTDMNSIKPHVEDYKMNKQRGVGFVAAITLLAGGAGGLFAWFAATYEQAKGIINQ